MTYAISNKHGTNFGQNDRVAKFKNNLGHIIRELINENICILTITENENK